MNATKIIAAGFAALLLSAGTVAAIPGQAADAGTDNANDEAAEAAAAAEDAGGGDASEMKSNASDEKPAVAEDASERRGPPTDMPEQVPDHVVRIHETINQFLDGDLEGSLGAAISDLTPGEADAEDESADAGDESENADEQSTETADEQSTETPEQADEDAEQADSDDSDADESDETTADA